MYKLNVTVLHHSSPTFCCDNWQLAAIHEEIKSVLTCLWLTPQVAPIDVIKIKTVYTLKLTNKST